MILDKTALDKLTENKIFINSSKTSTEYDYCNKKLSL